MFSVVECVVLPVWAGMTVNTSSKLYTTAIEYTCGGNYMFADNAQFKESTCNYLGYWVPSIIECVGTYV